MPIRACASGSPVRSLGPSGVAVGSTTCGHLPKIVARRVRWRLPPPPPSPPDARTPGSRGANSAFFFEFQVIAADLGRVPKKTRRGRGKAAASVQRIVSRTGFRGPGLGASADSGGRRFGLRNPERSTGSRCAYASRHPRYPGVIPCYPGYKTFDRAQGSTAPGSVCRRSSRELGFVVRGGRSRDTRHHHFGRRSSSAWAKNAEAFRKISLARRSSRTYGVEPICALVPIAPSTSYEQKARLVDPARARLSLRSGLQRRCEISISTTSYAREAEMEIDGGRPRSEIVSPFLAWMRHQSTTIQKTRNLVRDVFTEARCQCTDHGPCTILALRR